MSKLDEYNKRSKSSPCAQLQLPPELEQFKSKYYDQYLKPHGLEIPGYAIRPLEEAIDADETSRIALIERARQKFEICYLAAWSKGAIKIEATKPMPEEVKRELREINEQRREERRALKERINKVVAATETKVVVKTSKQAKTKIPVFQDVERQKELKRKYQWVVEGSFRQDPHKAGGTCLDIKCIKCGGIRTIHLADCFQTKLCLKCRGTNGRK